ncbi:MAG: peptidoglycan-binding domain-containing protein [Minisyncoccota bacterium]
MFKKAAGAFALLFLFAPFFASAQSTCPALSLGSTGAGVTEVQTILQSAYTNFPTPTGYFGPLTQAALKQWQEERGLEPVGIVGPKTAAAMKLSCTTATPTTSPTATAPSIPAVTPSANPEQVRTLVRGLSGADVLALQQFLISQGLLSPDSATGYFGVLTESAVKALQARSGIASSGSPATTGFGVVGPRTRAMIALSSNGNTASTINTPPYSQSSYGSSDSQGSYGAGYAQASYYSQGSYLPSYSQASYYAQGSYIATSSTPASCVFNGQTVASGSSVTAYQSSSVPTGSQCVSQQRACANGTLSGTFASASCTVIAPPLTTTTTDTLCYECLQVRVGRPVIMRQAVNDELDGQVPHIKLGNGKFRAFSSEFSSYAIDGNYVSDVWSGSRVKVLSPGPVGSNSQCGRWLNAVVPDPANNRLIGFVHEERMSNTCTSPYNPHKSMAIAFSYDEGLTWSNPYNPGSPTAQIIGGTDAIDDSKVTGEGDCSAVKGRSNDIYLYCLRTSDNAFIVAHASLSDLSPSGWKKYYNGSFSEPGIGGRSDAIPGAAVTVGIVKQMDRVIAGQYQSVPGGGVTINLSFSKDFTNFTSSVLKAGLLYFENVSWTRPQTYDSSTYVGPFINYTDGTNAVDTGNFGLNYVWYPPGGDANTKYLVLNDISMTVLSSPPFVQVATELTRSKKQGGRYRSTTGPMSGSDYWTWEYEKTLGYVMTGPNETDKPTNKLEECKSNWTDEYLTDIVGMCDPNWYNHYRTVGWVFQNQETGTQPIYRCWSASLSSHFVSNQADCESKGNMERLLGYVLAQ